MQEILVHRLLFEYDGGVYFGNHGRQAVPGNHASFHGYHAGLWYLDARPRLVGVCRQRLAVAQARAARCLRRPRHICAKARSHANGSDKVFH